MAIHAGQMRRYTTTGLRPRGPPGALLRGHSCAGRAGTASGNSCRDERTHVYRVEGTGSVPGPALPRPTESSSPWGQTACHKNCVRQKPVIGLDVCRLGYYKGDNVLLESLPTATCREQRKRRSLYQWGITVMKTEGSSTHSTRGRGGALRHDHGVLLVMLLVLGWLYSDAKAAPVRSPWLQAPVDGFYRVRRPIDIIDLADPVNAAALWNQNIVQDNDIDMRGIPLIINAADPAGGPAIAGTQIGGWDPVAGVFRAFTGTYDGQGYTIRNLVITGDGNGATGQDVADGLFGYVNGPAGAWPNAVISNLILESPTITGSATDVGGLVGYLQTGTIFQCCVLGGQITAGGAGVNAGTGSLVGFMNSTLVAGDAPVVWQCFTTCNVTGPTNVGGLVGRMLGAGSLVLDSFASNHTVTGEGTPFPPNGNPNLGGLVGLNVGGAISSCYADCLAPITPDGNVNFSFVGALVGSWFWGFVFVVPNFCDSTDAAVAVAGGFIPAGVANAVAPALLQAPGTYTGWNFGWGWGSVWSPPVPTVQEPRLLWRPF